VPGHSDPGGLVLAVARGENDNAEVVVFIRRWTKVV
jgi:hypothetical protein